MRAKIKNNGAGAWCYDKITLRLRKKNYEIQIISEWLIQASAHTVKYATIIINL